MGEARDETVAGAGRGARRDPRDLRVAAYAGSLALFMLAMAYAAVPLYQIFCQVTGFGGTTQRAEKPSDVVLDRTVVVRFDANVANGLGWTFKPVVRTMTVRVGESTLAFYRATNTSSVPQSGTASFNVAPEAAGQHFAKVECFCFTEQVLQPGESVDMPVSFFIDPGFVDDSDARGISQITLSYTFFPTQGGQTVPQRDAKSDTERKGAAAQGTGQRS